MARSKSLYTAYPTAQGKYVVCLDSTYEGLINGITGSFYYLTSRIGLPAVCIVQDFNWEHTEVKNEEDVHFMLSEETKLLTTLLINPHGPLVVRGNPAVMLDSTQYKTMKLFSGREVLLDYEANNLHRRTEGLAEVLSRSIAVSGFDTITFINSFNRFL